jgi:hypothetical protein
VDVVPLANNATAVPDIERAPAMVVVPANVLLPEVLRVRFPYVSVVTLWAVPLYSVVLVAPSVCPV